MLLYLCEAPQDGEGGRILKALSRNHNEVVLAKRLKAACAVAGERFSWMRQEGYRQLSQLLASGSDDLPALTAALDHCHQQMLEAFLSCMERSPPDVGSKAGAPLGCSLTIASIEELRSALHFCLGLCLLHLPSRYILQAERYRQLLLSRARSLPPSLSQLSLQLLLVLVEEPQVRVNFMEEEFPRVMGAIMGMSQDKALQSVWWQFVLLLLSCQEDGKGAVGWSTVREHLSGEAYEAVSNGVQQLRRSTPSRQLLEALVRTTMAISSG